MQADGGRGREGHRGKQIEYLLIYRLNNIPVFDKAIGLFNIIQFVKEFIVIIIFQIRKAIRFPEKSKSPTKDVFVHNFFFISFKYGKI